MNNQPPQPQPPQFSIAELGAKFGTQLGQANAEIITLEKQLLAQQARIQELTKTETRLTEHAQDLEDDLAALKAQNFEIQRSAEDQIDSLENDLETLRAEAQTLRSTAGNAIEVNDNSEIIKATAVSD